MAGRGRGATLPAWMTAGQGTEIIAQPIASAAVITSNLPESSNIESRYGAMETSVVSQNDKISERSHKRSRSADGEKDTRRTRSTSRGRKDTDSDRDRKDRNRDREKERDRSHRDRSRDREREKDRTHRDRDRDRDRGRDLPEWKPKSYRIRGFDVMPQDGMELPPLAVNNPNSGVPNSFYSYVQNPVIVSENGTAKPNYQPPNSSYVPKIMDSSPQQMLTRHARRIYAGGIPPRTTEPEIMQFFNEVVKKCLLPMVLPEDPVIKSYVNVEKCYAFVEFSSMELATAAMNLDGIRFDHYTGSVILRVRRPNDYRPDQISTDLGPIPHLNVAAIGDLASSVSSGQGKIFVGGIPYTLNDDQVKELLGAFGPLRSFHLVRDPGTNLPKGYAFCEFVETQAGDTAIEGLNGLQIGDKTLNVRYATTTTGQSNSVVQPGAGLMMNSNPLGLTGLTLGNVTLGAGMGSMNPLMTSNTGLNSNPFMGNAVSTAPTSKVLKLTNMITAEEIEDDNEWEDIREDVRLECIDQGKGPVLQVLIPRPKDGYPTHLAGNIYVHFQNVENAKACAQHLNGRKFADKTVVVHFYDEARFTAGQLD